MKKGLKWVCIILLSVVYGILLYIQYRNFQCTHTIYEEQYDRNVNNALQQFAQEIEKEETLDQVDVIFQELMNSHREDYGNLLKNTYNSVSKRKPLKLVPDARVLSKDQRDIISKTTIKLREEKYLQKLHSKEVLEQVLSTYFSNVYVPKTIHERVNFENFQSQLTDLLGENGISDKFLMNVTNFSGKIIYGKPFENNAVKVYSHKLFPHESSSLYFINISIPKREGLSSLITRLFLPTFVINLILFLCFVAVAIVLFLQRELSVIKNEFISNLTHELKTPISSISLASQLLKDEMFVKSPEKLDRISEILTEETKRLGFQIEKVLQISVLDKEKSLMNLNLLNVNSIIEDAVKNFSFKIESHHGMLHSDLNAENPYAMIDELHFTNVIYNLMDNALKYRDSNRNLILKIRSWNKDKKLCISIEDNGIGIKKNELKSIFKRFYRATTGDLHNTKGFGLGLSYVKKIVKNHKGNISVESEFGIGTRFTIEIPFINNK